MRRTKGQATWLGKLRERVDMTQEEFAQAIGVTVSTVNRWENGHINPSRLAKKAISKFSREKGLTSPWD